MLSSKSVFFVLHKISLYLPRFWHIRVWYIITKQLLIIGLGVVRLYVCLFSTCGLIIPIQHWALDKHLTIRYLLGHQQVGLACCNALFIAGEIGSTHLVFKYHLVLSSNANYKLGNQLFFKRSQYIRIENPLHKQSEKACFKTRRASTRDFKVHKLKSGGPLGRWKNSQLF